MTLKEILHSLNTNDRRLLTYAFENGLAQHVVVHGLIYIGVHLPDSNPAFKESERAGVWSCGELTKAKDIE